MAKPMQKIFFGPPGCGKSFYVRQVAIDNLKIAETLKELENNPNMIEATFHPEYGYGDFVAKLLPKSKPEGGIEYLTHAGPLIKALARAYVEPDQPVLLVIDEINRGNCAQIFGDIFQLLDRRDDGWSEYGVDPSDLIMDALKQEMGEGCLLPKLVQVKAKDKDSKEIVSGYKLRLPPNLSLIGTMNTSDESVYYMDTAFKRRWNFKYMPWRGESVPESQAKAAVGEGGPVWLEFLDKLNAFIAHEFKERNVDDKQVGIWFLKALNLPQLTTHTEPVEKRIVLSKNLATLILKLGKLIGVPKQETWASSFNGAAKFTGEVKGKAKPGYLESMSIKKSLKDSYQIDIPESVFTGNKVNNDPTYLAEKLIEYILTNDLTTHIEAKEVSHIGEIVGETTGIGEPVITHAAIQNKLMFFLWDNVFSRDREPLHKLLKDNGSTDEKHRTFGAFASDINVGIFIKGVMAWPKVETAPALGPVK